MKLLKSIFKKEHKISILKTLLLCFLIACFLLLHGCSSKNNKKENTEEKSSSSKVSGASAEKEISNNGIDTSDTSVPVKTDSGINNKTPSFSNEKIPEITPRESLNMTNEDLQKKKSGGSKNNLSDSTTTEQNNDEQLDSTDQDEITDRVTALEELQDLPEQELLLVLKKAMDDYDPQVRLTVVEIIESTLRKQPANISKEPENSSEEPPEAEISETEMQIKDILLQGVIDENEEIRMDSIMAAEDLPVSLRLEILHAVITSSYDDVKQEAIFQLTDLSSPSAFEILTLGLKDSNPAICEETIFAIEFLVSEEFDKNGYNEINNWWKNNKHLYDKNLDRLQDED